MIKKGDRIKLVKPMGAFANVGEICEVLDVTNGVIDFRFGNYHKGQMSMDELEKYFEIVQNEVKNAAEFVVGQLIALKTEHEGLKPMKQWDFFEVEEILPTGVARLFCHTDGTTRYVSIDILNSHFVSVDERYQFLNNHFVSDGESPHIKYEDDKDCENYSSASYICKCDGDRIIPLGVCEDEIDRLLNGSEVKVFSVFGKCTIVACRLSNGFVITESSACVSPEKYDEETGIEICMRKVKDKIWELEGYFLQKTLQNEEFCCDIKDECKNCEDCENCEEPDCSYGA